MEINKQEFNDFKTTAVIASESINKKLMKVNNSFTPRGKINSEIEVIQNNITEGIFTNLNEAIECYNKLPQIENEFKIYM